MKCAVNHPLAQWHKPAERPYTLNQQATVKISVTIADRLPDDVYYALGRALEDTPVDYVINWRIPKPVGEMVASPYVEAKIRLLSSHAVFLVLCRDGNGHIIDDWTLPLLPGLRAAGIRVFAYLIKTTGIGTVSSPASVLVEAGVQVRLLPTFDDIVPHVISDVESLYLTT